MKWVTRITSTSKLMVTTEKLKIRFFFLLLPDDVSRIITHSSTNYFSHWKIYNTSNTGWQDSPLQSLIKPWNLNWVNLINYVDWFIHKNSMCKFKKKWQSFFNLWCNCNQFHSTQSSNSVRHFWSRHGLQRQQRANSKSCSISVSLHFRFSRALSLMSAYCQEGQTR